MTFDMERFAAARFLPREEDVRADELAGYFGAGDDPVFRVRGLTGEEMFRVAEERKSSELKAAIADALAGGQSAEVAEALKEAIGLGQSVPDSMAVAISKVHFGLVEPRLDRDQVVRLFADLPNVAVRLMAAIDKLSGQGPEMGKSQSSGGIPE